MVSVYLRVGGHTYCTYIDVYILYPGETEVPLIAVTCWRFTY